MPSRRCIIDLGDKRDPRSPRFRIALIRSELVRTSIEGYLTQRGTVLDRDTPPEWFQWLDDLHTIFQTRCADPPQDDEPDDGKQPFNYFVRATISTSRRSKQRATGEDFYHESALLPPLKPLG
jgi:hypothetical protein